MSWFQVLARFKSMLLGLCHLGEAITQRGCAELGVELPASAEATPTPVDLTHINGHAAHLPSLKPPRRQGAKQ
jgi:hypothetical protein